MNEEDLGLLRKPIRSWALLESDAEMQKVRVDAHFGGAWRTFTLAHGDTLEEVYDYHAGKFCTEFILLCGGAQISKYTKIGELSRARAQGERGELDGGIAVELKTERMFRIEEEMKSESINKIFSKYKGGDASAMGGCNCREEKGGGGRAGEESGISYTVRYDKVHTIKVGGSMKRVGDLFRKAVETLREEKGIGAPFSRISFDGEDLDSQTPLEDCLMDEDLVDIC